VNQPRAVRVDPRFFEQLDAQLGPERGPAGEPSSTDFLLVDLPPIAETFAEHFVDLQMLIPGREDYRVVITAGLLVPRLSVIGQMIDDVIVLVGVELDFEAGW
jgi:hypothetical protein